MDSESERVSRQSNFEALRIVCIISIVVLHIWTQTEAINLKPDAGWPYFLFVLFGYGGRLVCNCFVMIGAWFLCDTEFKSERVVKLWMQIFFYAVTITVICTLLKFPDADLVRLIQAFLPIMGRPVWFPAEYILLLMLSPFLNKLLIWEEGQYCRKILIFLAVLIMIPATLFPIEYTKPVFSELVCFCFLYLYIAYIKRHPMHWMEKRMRVYIGAVSMYSFNVAVYIILDDLGLKSYAHYYMSHYETVFSFITSVLLFIAFKNINLGRGKIINFIGGNTFAVYLLHALPCLCITLWNGIFNVDDNLDNPLYIVSVVVIIFVVAMVVESIRKRVFDRLIYKAAIYKKVCRKIDGFYLMQTFL